MSAVFCRTVINANVKRFRKTFALATLLSVSLSLFAACKLSFHKECSQFSCKFPCQPIQTSSPQSPTWHRPWEPLVQKSKHTSRKFSTVFDLPSASGGGLQTQSPQSSKWSLTRTSQFTDPTDQVVGCAEDLRQMSIFIFKKVRYFH